MNTLIAAAVMFALIYFVSPQHDWHDALYFACLVILYGILGAVGERFNIRILKDFIRKEWVFMIVLFVVWALIAWTR